MNRGVWPRAALAWAMVAGLALAQDPAPAAPHFTATLIDGSTASGQLVALQLGSDGTGFVSLASTPPRVIPIGELVKLVRTQDEFPTPMNGERSSSVILFPEGDELSAKVGASDDRALEAVPFLPSGAPVVKVPLDSPIGIILQTPAGSAERVALFELMRDPRRDGEVIWLANGDRRTGSFLGLSADKVRFDSGTGPAEFPRAGVTALGLDPALIRYPRPKTSFLQFTLVDGTRLGAVGGKIEAGRGQIMTRFGSPLAVTSESLTSVTVLGGTITYLSDLEPAAAQYVGFLGRHPQSFGRDRTWEGTPIRLGDKPFDRGLGMLPRTLLAFRIEGGSKRFQATIGLDERAGPLSSVIFRVLLDRREVYVSPSMTRLDQPRTVDVDLGDARLLILIVDFGERGDVQDSAVWGDARLIRSSPGPE